MLWWLNLNVRDMDSNVCQEQSEGPKPDFTELSQSEKTGFFSSAWTTASAGINRFGRLFRWRTWSSET